MLHAMLALQSVPRGAADNRTQLMCSATILSLSVSYLCNDQRLAQGISRCTQPASSNLAAKCSISRRWIKI
jgi:hypothetical protein